LVTTYHTYADKKKIVLKDTHWYLYSVDGRPALTPQTEEDIFKAEWVAGDRLEDYKSNAFLLIRDVLKEAGF
jgi:hypothetical protein